MTSQDGVIASADRINRFLLEYFKLSNIDKEKIYELHPGTERHAILKTQDIMNVLSVMPVSVLMKIK